VNPRSRIADSLFGQPAPEDAHILEDFGNLAQKARPLSARQQLGLGLEIKRLFHFLADERGTRRVDYLNNPASLAAYIRSYHWWNLVRLIRLFSGPVGTALIPAGGAEEIPCVDLGSGPFTVPIALWLSRPELRRRPLVWYCVDRSKSALTAGEELFLAAAARTVLVNGDGPAPWRIVRVPGDVGTKIRRKARLVCAANVLNELIQARSSSCGREPQGQRYAALLSAYADPDAASVLVVEPGTPPSARLLSSLRSAFGDAGWQVSAPCPHSGPCPMDGRSAKWCNFAFSSRDAPRELRSVSKSAGLPKERVGLSFLLMHRTPSGAGLPGIPPGSPAASIPVRVTSDAIILPGGRTGFYGCSKLGLVVLECAAGEVASKGPQPRLESGALVYVEGTSKGTDRKTGGIFVEF
jgi:hypothetical protein